MTKSRDASQDLIRGLGPHERRRVRVREVDVPADGLLELHRPHWVVPLEMGDGEGRASMVLRSYRSKRRSCEATYILASTRSPRGA